MNKQTKIVIAVVVILAVTGAAVFIVYGPNFYEGKVTNGVEDAALRLAKAARFTDRSGPAASLTTATNTPSASTTRAPNSVQS